MSVWTKEELICSFEDAQDAQGQKSVMAEKGKTCAGMPIKLAFLPQDVEKIQNRQKQGMLVGSLDTLFKKNILHCTL